MKRCLCVAVFLLGWTGLLRSEDFDGTMIWSARIELTDPEAREQLAMVEAALKSPELLAMLLDNPQVRGVLEQKLGPINPAAGATRVLPTGFTVQIKGPRALVRTEGGLVSREVLALADKNAAYALDRRAKTYQRLAGQTRRPSVKAKVTRTPDTATLLGYACHRYLVETEEGGSKARFSVWTTTAIKADNTGAFKGLQWADAGGFDFLAQVEGLPLKIEAATPEAKIALLATRITPGAPPDAVLTLPAGFKETRSSGR